MPARATTIAGQRFDDRIRLADADLLLDGVSQRAVAWFRGYATGRYLNEKAATLAAVLATTGPKRLQMRMMCGVDTKEFSKTINVGIQRNSTPAELVVLKAVMAQFDRTVEQIGAVRAGDVINLDFVPGQGLILSVNGTPRGTPILGEDLYGGPLKIFVGVRPVDARLKAGLLGSAPA